MTFPSPPWPSVPASARRIHRPDRVDQAVRSAKEAESPQALHLRARNGCGHCGPSHAPPGAGNATRGMEVIIRSSKMTKVVLLESLCWNDLDWKGLKCSRKNTSKDSKERNWQKMLACLMAYQVLFHPHFCRKSGPMTRYL